MKKISLMGIDGSGKTTLMRALQRTDGERSSFLFSPDFHEVPGFAGGAESRALTEFSRLADEYADPRLKLTSLYLRMCLFGEAEAFLAATERRETLYIERHPLIDSLTYLPVYIGAVKKLGARVEDSESVMARVTRKFPEIAAHVQAAVARRNQRMGLDSGSVEHLAQYCMGFAALAPLDFVQTLSRDFQTTLPDLVVYLDLPPAQAFERIALRGKALEAHESLENLTRLDRLAKSKFAEFEKLGVRCAVLPVSTLPEAAVLGAITQHLEAAHA
jgi:hypothetical protein